MANYALDNTWDRAHHRLALLEQHLDPMSHRRLAELGVREGWRCLEVGGGLGSMARWLSRQVGVTGHVTVTDIDTRFLQEIEEPNIKVWRHDVTADDLPATQFDLVHIRWLLYHLTQPEQVVARIVAALRPGGWLLIEDVDFFPVYASRSQLYFDFMVALTGTVAAAAGHDGFWAARALPALVAGQELVEVGGEADIATLNGGTPMAEFWQLTGKQMRDKVLSSGTLSADRFNAAMTLLNDPTFRTFSSAGIAVWGRCPNEQKQESKTKG